MPNTLIVLEFYYIHFPVSFSLPRRVAPSQSRSLVSLPLTSNISHLSAPRS